MTGTPTHFDVEALRAAEFPRLGSGVWLNAASMTPLPERTRRAVDAYSARRAAIHELRDADFEPTLRRARQAAARLIGAEADEIALTPSTSVGVNLAADVVPVRPGTRIVLSDREFPANVYPWMRLARERDVRLDVVPCDAAGRPDEDRILEELDRGDVSVFALSQVQFSNGWLHDLSRFGGFCREREIAFVVDAMQALGQVPTDVKAAEVDVLVTGGNKWLCAPFGTGFAYVRRELLASADPHVVGWTAMAASADYADVLDYRWEPVDDGRRFEHGTMPFQDCAGLAESIGLLLEVGVERIRRHVLALLDPVARALAARGAAEVTSDLSPARRSGILAFRPADAARVHRALHAAGIVCVVREGAVRLAPHLYNTAGEMARVLEVLREEGVA